MLYEIDGHQSKLMFACEAAIVYSYRCTTHAVGIKILADD